VTPIDVGRDPPLLRRIAIATGVKVVMGTAYYVHDYHPPEIARMTEDEVAELLAADFEKGTGDPAIRAGIIGEIGLVWPVHPEERKVLRGAAKAQRRTGLGLSIHPGRDAAAPLDAVRTVEDAGGDPRRTIVCHLDRTLFDIEGYLELAKTGCYLEFDLFGLEMSHYPLAEIDMPNDAIRVDKIVELVKAGHIDRVLVSHDIDSKTRLRVYGGEGYHHILRNVVPLMRRKGLSEVQVNRILIENPRRILTIV
jgi:phosphotriesterase-related protein